MAGVGDRDCPPRVGEIERPRQSLLSHRSRKHRREGQGVALYLVVEYDAAGIAAADPDCAAVDDLEGAVIDLVLVFVERAKLTSLTEEVIVTNGLAPSQRSFFCASSFALVSGK